MVEVVTAIMEGVGGRGMKWEEWYHGRNNERMVVIDFIERFDSFALAVFAALKFLSSFAELLTAMTPVSKAEPQTHRFQKNAVQIQFFSLRLFHSPLVKTTS